MTAVLANLTKLAPQLLDALFALERTAQPLDLAPLAGREWFELLERKLVPQLGESPFLIVAVTGGTNIGKSVVFNHLAGFRASASSPLASGTKHPVLLIPEGFAERCQLSTLFPSFHLREWAGERQALEDSDEHELFWRTSAQLPPNLLLLDTPDVDSDAPVNWERADAIRQTADVLIAILTQQKYNDAAVKQFFRKAAAEGKPAVVVFNQCELPDDELYWPIWLRTFTQETGIEPLYVYLAPNDRQRAESIALTFLERTWNPESLETTNPPEVLQREASASIPAESIGLQEVFSRLRFDEIKWRSLEGAVRCVADEREGLPTFLREISVRSGEFQTAAELLGTHQLAAIDDWPTPPSRLLVTAAREWWAANRQGWSATVHGFYDTVGQSVLTPFRWARDWTQGAPPPPWENYREREWDAIVRVVAKIYQKLEWLADLGQPLLKDRIERQLSGTSRADVLTRLQADHALVDFSGLLEATVGRELQFFQQENPQLYRWVRRLDEATAAARPALTIVLGMTGIGLPVGEAATHLASQGLMQSAMHVAGDVVAGTATATVGESAISATASSGAGYLQAKFHRLQEAFTAQRVQWLATALEQQLLGSLSGELQSAAHVARSAEFRKVTELLQKWRAPL